MQLQLSHAGTVVPETTTQVNGKVGNSTPAPSETPEPIVTKICMDDYVGDPYPYAKFHHDTITPFEPQICENAHQVTRLVFLVLPTAYSQDPCTNFYDQYVKWRGFVSFDVLKELPFGGPENKILHFDPIFPQKRKFFANFRRDFENFASKRP